MRFAPLLKTKQNFSTFRAKAEELLTKLSSRTLVKKSRKCDKDKGIQK